VQTEIKFRVSRATGEQLRAWARARLQADPFGRGTFGDEYRTATIYFDTPAFDVFQRRGSYGRSKYRIRRYDGEPTAFLERKMRQDGRLAKRREQVALPGDACVAPTPNWFFQRIDLRGLGPVCQITYERLARVGTCSAGPIRMTVDDAVRAVRLSRPGFVRDLGTPVAGDELVVELKYPGLPPAVFKEVVEEFRLVPGRVSKYRLAVDALGLIREDAVAPSAIVAGDATYA
jgi:hypothetical protein